MRSAPPVSAFRDHYAVLGVDPDAGDAEIKAAFWELAKRYHPDVSQGGTRAAQRFAEITEAKSVLLSRSRRAAYDRELEAHLHGETEPAEAVAETTPLSAGRLWRGGGLLLAGAATVLVTVRFLPIATFQGLHSTSDIGAFDGGVLTGAACCAACALLAVLCWPAWSGSMSQGRWEVLMAFLVLWLCAGLAGQVDAHLILGGLFSSDVQPATGGYGLIGGVALMLGGAILIRPAHRRAGRDPS
jgi:hypothetical protein